MFREKASPRKRALLSLLSIVWMAAGERKDPRKLQMGWTSTSIWKRMTQMLQAAITSRKAQRGARSTTSEATLMQLHITQISRLRLASQLHDL